VPGLLALSSGTSKKTSELGLSAGPRSDFTTLRYWKLKLNNTGGKNDK